MVSSNSEDANDLAQEALLRMYKFQHSQKSDNPLVFLFKTANNFVIDQIRRAKVHDRYINWESSQVAATSEDPKCSPSAERTVSAERELDQIYRVVDDMPEKVKRAFLLHRGKDMSYSEIAQEMGVSISMVEKHIVKALKILRQEIAGG